MHKKKYIFLFLLFLVGNNIFSIHAMANDTRKLCVKNHTSLRMSSAAGISYKPGECMNLGKIKTPHGSISQGKKCGMASLSFKNYNIVLYGKNNKFSFNLEVGIPLANSNHGEEWVYSIAFSKTDKIWLEPTYEEDNIVLNITPDFLTEERKSLGHELDSASSIQEKEEILEKYGIIFSTEAFTKYPEMVRRKNREESYKNTPLQEHIPALIPKLINTGFFYSSGTDSMENCIDGLTLACYNIGGTLATEDKKFYYTPIALSLGSAFNNSLKKTSIADPSLYYTSLDELKEIFYEVISTKLGPYITYFKSEAESLINQIEIQYDLLFGSEGYLEQAARGNTQDREKFERKKRAYIHNLMLYFICKTCWNKDIYLPYIFPESQTDDLTHDEMHPIRQIKHTEINADAKLVSALIKSDQRKYAKKNITMSIDEKSGLQILFPHVEILGVPHFEKNDSAIDEPNSNEELPLNLTTDQQKVMEVLMVFLSGNKRIPVDTLEHYGIITGGYDLNQSPTKTLFIDSTKAMNKKLFSKMEEAIHSVAYLPCKRLSEITNAMYFIKKRDAFAYKKGISAEELTLFNCMLKHLITTLQHIGQKQIQEMLPSVTPQTPEDISIALSNALELLSQMPYGTFCFGGYKR